MADSHEFVTSPVARSGQSDDWFDMNQRRDQEFASVSLPHENHSSACTSPARKISSCAAVVLNTDHHPASSRPTDHLTSVTLTGSPVKGLLSAMEGKTWSQFIAQDRSPDHCRTTSKSIDCENMTLKREDMPIFGLFPARDQFYCTKCDHCGQVVKYQALAHHMESRHSQPVVGIETPPSSTRSESSGSTSSLSNNLTTCDQQPGLDAEYSNATISRLTPSPGTDSPGAELPLTATARLSHQQQQNGTTSSTAGLCINISSMCITASSSSPSPSNHFVHHNHTSSDAVTNSPTPPSDASSAGVSLLKSAVTSVKLKVPGSGSNHTNTLTADLLTSSGSKSKKSASLSSNLLKEKLLPCKDRQYDPDKHCGVLTEHMDKACTRSLTCKTHSLTLRRQVTGRSKPFDDLLEEHRVAKEEALRLAGKEVKLTKKQIKQREQEAKKALVAQQKQDKSDSKSMSMSPASSSQPSPASSPCVSTGTRPLPSSAQSFVSSLPSPAAAAAATAHTGSQMITSPSPVSIAKQSLQNNLTAKIKRKEKEDSAQLLQQQQQQQNVPESCLNNDLPPPPPLIPIRDHLSRPLIHRPADMRVRQEGPDGIDYMKFAPRPLAVNTYNMRTRNLTNSRNFDSSSISSHMFSRSGDRTYAQLMKVFPLPLQENSSIVAPMQQSASKSKKKKNNASSSNTCSKVTAVSDSSSSCVQSPAVASEFDPIVSMAPPVTNCLPNSTKNDTSAIIPKNNCEFPQQPSPSARKRSAPVSSIASVAPSLTSLLESGISTASSPIISLGFDNNRTNFSPIPLTGSLSPSLTRSLPDATALSPVPKRLRPSDPLSENNNSSTAGTYALSAPSLESLLDAGIGSRTPNRSLFNESSSSSHSILSATLESGYNPNISNRTPDASGGCSGAAAMTVRPQAKSSNVQNSPHLISLLDSRSSCDVTSGIATGLRSHAAVSFNKKLKKADPKLTNNNLIASYGIRQKVAPSPNSS